MLEVADFGGKAISLLNFQRYTSHAADMLTVTNEVEFNLVTYPANREPNVPAMSIEDWLIGEDQTKTIGHLRLHVAADNAFAVDAGIKLFGEPKFVDTFTYNVPSLNSNPANNWEIRLNDPEDKAEEKDPSKFIYVMNADLEGLDFVPVSPSPIPEFATGLGRTVWTRWNVIGNFEHAMLSADEAKRMSLKIGNCKHPMTEDLRKLIGEDNPAIAVQTFDSQPACIEPRGFYADVMKP